MDEGRGQGSSGANYRLQSRERRETEESVKLSKVWVGITESEMTATLGSGNFTGR